jgi:hypothetical protein
MHEKQYTTEETILKQDEFGYTMLHEVYNLLEIPTEYITEKSMLVKSNDGNTPLHYAARFGRLMQVPLNILTEQNMLVTNNEGDTPLIYAASRGKLQTIPVALLTENSMLQKGKDGITPLHYAAIYCQLRLLPKKILTTENLLVKSDYGATPFGNSFYNANSKVLPLKTMVACATNPKTKNDIENIIFNIIKLYFVEDPVISWLELNKQEQQALALTFANSNVPQMFFPKEGIIHFINAMSDNLEHWNERDIEAWHKMIYYPWRDDREDYEYDKYELKNF